MIKRNSLTANDINVLYKKKSALKRLEMALKSKNEQKIINRKIKDISKEIIKLKRVLTEKV